ncbi:hypothetical protein E1264_30910 [Actinomadura sp. KC216]|uniref:hypothetical protein n=1 Tax=Actinomadura sp. KC216 TaxID=2530370 RepID=UPI00104C3187|nr:hypothetical protein [Actinomadura sp. KC216]TDB82848.1 hypothetical protein E1264_30910 [Actinomadura sp. KC216]
MLTVARAALYGVVPAEVVFAVLLVAGVPLPRLVVVAGEALVTAVIVLEVIAACRLVWERRRDGAGWRDALRSVDRLVPERVRRIMAFDMKGLVSVVLLVVRRRHGVPPGAVSLPYAGGQLTLQLAFLFAMVVEAAVAEMLLRGVGADEGVRSLVLVVDLYSILVVVAIIAACVTRPHVLSDDELRVRYGAFFDLRVPRDLLSSVRLARNFNESGMVRVVDERLSVAVASQTNVVIELSEPIVAVRPLGKRVTVRTVRFFTDDPAALVDALTRPQS